MTKLKISFTRDYSDNFLFDIDTLDFQRAASAIFAGSQFDGNQLDDHFHIDGSAGANRIVVNTSIRGLDAHGWSFSDWQSADRLVVNGSLWSERLIGTSRRDDIFGNDGRDEVKAEAGDGQHATLAKVRVGRSIRLARSDFPRSNMRGTGRAAGCAPGQPCERREARRLVECETNPICGQRQIR